jgi:uncharacterized membrane protein
VKPCVARLMTKIGLLLTFVLTFFFASSSVSSPTYDQIEKSSPDEEGLYLDTDPSVSPSACSRANPTVTVVPSLQHGSAGETLTYTISLTNNDTSACGASSFDLGAALPFFLTITFGHSNINVQPGQSGSTSLNITSAAFVPPGNYSFTLIAVNQEAPFFSGSAAGNYVIDNPPPCPHANPTLTITPSSQLGIAGETLAYSISITNNDSSTCVASTFDLGYAIHRGFSASVDQTLVNLRPGQSATISLNVTSKFNSPPAKYAIKVTATNQQASSFTESVTGTYEIGVGTCFHAPSISIMPSLQHGLPGETLVYTVSIVNNDNSACATSSFDLAATVPSGFTANFEQTAFSLPPGQSASTAVNITSSSRAVHGNYIFTITGTNQNSSLSNSASGTYVVLIEFLEAG